MNSFFGHRSVLSTQSSVLSGGRFIALTASLSGTYTRRILYFGSTMPNDHT